MLFRRYLPCKPPLPHPKWARSVAPAARCGRLKPLLPPRPAGAAARTHFPCALPQRGWAPKQTCHNWRNRHHLGACHVGTALKGAAATTSAYPDHHPLKRLGPYLSAGALLGGVPPPNPPHEMPFWRYLPASPPLPHPKWARSVAPAVRCGRLKPLFPPRPAGAAARTHVPCALPPRGRAPQFKANIFTP